MEPVGFALGVIPELRHQIQSMMTRIEKFRTGPETFQSLKTELDNMTKLIAEIEGAQKLNPKALPEVSSPWFSSRLKTVQDCLQEAETIMQQLCNIAFPAGNSEEPKRKRLRAMMQRLTRAKANAKEMAAVEEKVTKASRVLDLLTSELSLSIRVGDMGTKGTSAGAEPAYVPEGNTPALPHTVSLNFDLLDAEGKPATPEAFLKHYVLSEAAEVIAAAGVLNPAYGVVGMAGVGKTVALQGLAFDDDIHKHFSDGIHYMSLGKGATLQTVVGEIASIMRVTGAKQIADSVEKSSSVREAVNKAETWFRGRTSLFLVDDLWPTFDSFGYLHDLRQLLKRSPTSRMVITTRSTNIAQMAGSIVDFDARDPTGAVSERIFLSYAEPRRAAQSSPYLRGEIKSSVFKVLCLCGGLPIALAVAGCTVAKLAKLHKSFLSACDEYVLQLKKTKASLRDEPGFNGTSLNAGILLSLQYLKAEYEKWKKDYDVDTKYTVKELYVSLCVLQNQGWVPVSVLSRLWKLEDTEALKVANFFCEMSLATLQRRDRKADGNGDGQTAAEVGLMLHDLHLDFCQHQARKSKTTASWHSELLTGYLNRDEDSFDFALGGDRAGTEEQILLGFNARPWWSESVPNDGYIYDNVARHLVYADRSVELGALLLDARWTHLRMKVGGIAALQGDFESFGCFAGTMARGRKGCTFSKDIYESFALLFRALQVSWGRILGGRRELQFQMCGRLFKLRESNVVLSKYLESVLMFTEKPYLVPMTAFFPVPRIGEVMDISVGGICDAICCSPCGRYIAAGTNGIVVVLDSISGAILCRSEGYSKRVTSLVFTPDSKNILAPCHDNTIMLWTWETSKSRIEILEIREEAVTCVAIGSNGDHFLWGSEGGTVRLQDAASGAATIEYQPQPHVRDLILSPDGQKIALIARHVNKRKRAKSEKLKRFLFRLRVLDRCSGALLFESPDLEEPRAIAFSPNNLRLATYSSKTIHIWKTETWTLERTMKMEGVKSVAFSPNGKQIIAGLGEGCIRLWNVENWASGAVSGLYGGVNCVAFSSDGKRIIWGSADGRVRGWDSELVAHNGNAFKEEGCRLLERIAISRDGMRVASGDGSVRIWDCQTGAQIVQLFDGFTRLASCVSFSPDGRRLVSGHSDGVLRIWDLATFAFIGDPMRGHSREVRSVAFSFDGLRIVSGSRDKTIRVWDAVSQLPIGDPFNGYSVVDNIAESVDGLYIITNHQRDGDVVCIRTRTSGKIVWASGKMVVLENHDVETTSECINNKNEIVDSEALQIIRSCSYETSLLWPTKVPRDCGEVYVTDTQMYSKTLHETALLGSMPGAEAPAYYWRYNTKKMVFAAGLRFGADIVICRAVLE